MIGIVGIMGLLGCLAAISAVVAVAGIVVSVAVSASQAEQAEKLQNEQLAAQEKAEAKAENRLQSQKDAAYRSNERKHLANMMAMGSAIMIENYSTRKTKYQTIAELKNDAGSKPKTYNYGKPAQPVGNSQQSQGQTNA